MVELPARKSLDIDMLVAHVNFRYAMEDVNRLLRLHDAETKHRPGRPSRQLEVFKRAGVILSVTAWESFIEETLRACGRYNLQVADTPDDVAQWFNSVAHAWLIESPKPTSVSMWTGNRWKELLRRRFEFEVARLNTPSPQNIAALSKRYFGTDLCSTWTWRGMTAEAAARRLKTLIELRGDVVHNGPEFGLGTRTGDPEKQLRNHLRRRHVVDAINLLFKLVNCTYGVLVSRDADFPFA